MTSLLAELKALLQVRHCTFVIGTSLLSGCPALKTNPLLDIGICKQGVSDVLFSKTNSEFTGQERHCASKGRLSFMHTWLTPHPLLTDVQKILGALDQWPLWFIFCSFSPFLFFFKWWFISSPLRFIFLYNFFLERLFVILLVLDLKGKKWGGEESASWVLPSETMCGCHHLACVIAMSQRDRAKIKPLWFRSKREFAKSSRSSAWISLCCMILSEWSTFFCFSFFLGSRGVFLNKPDPCIGKYKGTCDIRWNHYGLDLIRPCWLQCLAKFWGLVSDQEMYGMTQITFKKIQTDKNHMGIDCGKTQKTGIKNYLAWMQTTMMQTISRRNFQ